MTMTLDEASKIAMIAGTADNGCSSCVGNMVERLNVAFPAFTWEMTSDSQYEQPDWSDDPEDEQVVGLVVDVRERR